MKTLDSQTRLGCAQAGIAVLRALKISDSKLTYQDFAKAIGMMADDEKWEVWHRTQVRDVLNLMAATVRQAGEEISVLPFERIVRKSDEEPGVGFYKESRIVSE